MIKWWARRRHSILVRVALLSSAVVLATVAAFALPIILYQSSILKRELRSKAQALASSIDQVTAKAVVAEDYAAVVEHCLNVLQRKDTPVVYVVVTRRNGFSLIHTASGWRSETLGGMWTREVSEKGGGGFVNSEIVNQDVYHLSFPFSYSEIPGGWIHIGLSLERYWANLRGVYAMTAALGGLALALGGVMSFFFARQLTKPIKQLDAFAERVAAGELNARADKMTNDELGELADALNTMTERLEQSRRELEESLRQQAALREKEILLREIHHRVKNNMQILSSLARMQARRTSNKEAQEALNETEGRIRSMALIHEKLYRAESLSEIDFQAYLKMLLAEIQRLHSKPGQDVRIEADAESVKLGIDTALPCGLIVTELVSNSLKHAFSDGRAGYIRVTLRPLAAGEYELAVHDNGVGLAPDAQLETDASLGTRLVRMLVDQLRGTMETTSRDGFATIIRFTESCYTQRL